MIPGPVAGLLAGVLLGGSVAAGAAQDVTSNPTAEKTPVTRMATGDFDVKLTPQPMHTAPGGAELARMTIDKQFHGELEAVSTGEMLSAMTRVKGSAGYVAIELVRGTLHGRTGTFVLQRRATMHRGAPELSVTVVPDSGTEELEGLSGEMQIIIEGGRHSYQFRYTLPEG